MRQGGWITTQDRDKKLQYDREMLLYAAPSIKFGQLFGVNVYLDQELLGTFDTPMQAAFIVDQLLSFDGEEYTVPGYHDEDELSEWWENIEEEMKDAI